MACDDDYLILKSMIILPLFQFSIEQYTQDQNLYTFVTLFWVFRDLSPAFPVAVKFLFFHHLVHVQPVDLKGLPKIYNEHFPNTKKIL